MNTAHILDHKRATASTVHRMATNEPRFSAELADIREMVERANAALAGRPMFAPRSLIDIEKDAVRHYLVAARMARKGYGILSFEQSMLMVRSHREQLMRLQRLRNGTAAGFWKSMAKGMPRGSNPFRVGSGGIGAQA